MKATATLLITCPDRKGLVACVSGLLYAHGANITHADQHQDREAGCSSCVLNGLSMTPMRPRSM